VRGLVVFETLLRPMHWSEWPPRAAELFRSLRTPGLGEKMVLEENAFLGLSLSNGVQRGLTAEERAVYAAPFATSASRRPMLQWPRELPIEREPADVAALITRYDAWLAATPEVPKLLLTFTSPGVLGSTAVIEFARTTFAALDVVALGPAGHHAPEDRPHDIGQAIASWLDQRRLLRAP
jgi:haloalkane dehalogenase